MTINLKVKDKIICKCDFMAEVFSENYSLETFALVRHSMEGEVLRFLDTNFIVVQFQGVPVIVEFFDFEQGFVVKAPAKNRLTLIKGEGH